MSQRTDLITVCNQNIVLVCGAFKPYATKRPMFEHVVDWVIFGAPDIQNQLSDFCKRRCALHNTCRRTSGPSLSLSWWLWPILQLWQDRSTHQFSENWVPYKQLVWPWQVGPSRPRGPVNTWRSQIWHCLLHTSWALLSLCGPQGMQPVHFGLHQVYLHM